MIGSTGDSAVGMPTEECKAQMEELFCHIIEADEDITRYRLRMVNVVSALLQHGISRGSRAYATKGQREIALEVEEIMIRDIHRQYTVNELSDQYDISPSALKKYFSLVFGKPISVYMREKRVEMAKKLLSESNISIGDIALKVGYAHQGKFGTVFKNATGSTPLDYRRQYRRVGTQ